VKEFWAEAKPAVMRFLAKVVPCMKVPEAAVEEAVVRPPPTLEEKIEFLDYLEDKYGELSRECVVN